MVIAGSPLRLFRLSGGGAHIISLAEAGAVPDTGAIRQMIDRFIDAGALHPEPEHGTFSVVDVTVVMPAHGHRPVALGSPALDGMAVVVVDDASTTPLDIVDAHLVRRPQNGGPAAARNTGLQSVATPLVAFVDADVVLPPDWLAPLLLHFTDDRVALVAPRVVSEPGRGLVADHETRHSPLDLGPDPARIAPGTRVSYVPAAVVVARTDAVREIGGFDESLRVGEDVDLVWRLVDDGRRCRYEPAVVVEHRPRDGIGPMLRQRRDYGTSAAPLARRHPGRLAPVRMSGWSALAWGLIAGRRPLLAFGVAAATTVALVRKLRDVPSRDAALLALTGHLAAGRQLARALRRVWWPLALVAAIGSRHARALVVAALVAPAIDDAIRTRSTRPLLDLPMAIADDAAYGAGVWRGVVAERDVGPLLPEFRNWPSRDAG